jgi:glycosyltransferase involved in cell wall biosynthesis
MDISVVIPLYNEEESLPKLMEEIHENMLQHNFSYEVLMIDDGSSDTSWEVIKSLQLKYSGLRGLRFQRNYGKSAALHVGFQAAHGDVVITMDADLQDNPKEVKELYDMVMVEGYDVISGWKKERHDPFSKTFPSKFFNALTRQVSGIKLNDFNCGLKAYKNDVVKNIEVYGEMHRYIPVMAKYAGFKKIGEKVVEHRAREFGKSKFSGLSRGVKGVLDLISLVLTQKYMKRPLHFFGFWGLLLIGIGGVDLLALLGIKIFMGEGITHRLPAMIFGSTALLMGMMLFSIGLLGELIGRNSPIRNEYKIKEEVGGELV